LLLNLLLD